MEIGIEEEEEEGVVRFESCVFDALVPIHLFISLHSPKGKEREGKER